MPQGRRVFASLSVRENLLVAQRASVVAQEAPGGAAAKSWSIEDVFETFPRLRERHAQAAGSLSGVKVADDVVILNTGRIVFDGTVEELRASPDLLQSNLGMF